MKGLTEKQSHVLQLVTGWISEHGYPPSIREVAKELGVNTATAQQHLDALEAKGRIQRSPGQRTLRVIGGAGDGLPATGLECARIPLVASIAAGSPIAVEELADSFIDFTPSYFGGDRLVALSVRGNSMSGDAIADGDVALIRLQASALPRDIAAVRVERSEVTLKRVRLSGPMAHLISSNPEHNAREVAAEHLEILGVLAGILRRTGSP